MDDVIFAWIPISMVTASVTSQMKLQTYLLVPVVSMVSAVHILEFPEVLHVYYRPQPKFAKVMFLHVSVCPQWGEYLGRCPLLQAGTPPSRYPPG